jgi:hypothetical protein
VEKLELTETGTLSSGGGSPVTFTLNQVISCQREM